MSHPHAHHLHGLVQTRGHRTLPAGRKPVRIFREAGLDPRIIGNKRIERCIARWKREPPDAGTTRPHAPAADAGREGRPAPMSVVLAQTMRINALEERLRRLELSMADGTTR